MLVFWIGHLEILGQAPHIQQLISELDLSRQNVVVDKSGVSEERIGVRCWFCLRGRLLTCISYWLVNRRYLGLRVGYVILLNKLVFS